MVWLLLFPWIFCSDLVLTCMVRLPDHKTAFNMHGKINGIVCAFLCSYNLLKKCTQGNTSRQLKQTLCAVFFPLFRFFYAQKSIILIYVSNEQFFLWWNPKEIENNKKQNIAWMHRKVYSLLKPSSLSLVYTFGDIDNSTPTRT